MSWWGWTILDWTTPGRPADSWSPWTAALYLFFLSNLSLVGALNIFLFYLRLSFLLIWKILIFFFKPYFCSVNTIHIVWLMLKQSKRLNKFIFVDCLMSWSQSFMFRKVKQQWNMWWLKLLGNGRGLHGWEIQENKLHWNSTVPR